LRLRGRAGGADGEAVAGVIIGLAADGVIFPGRLPAGGDIAHPPIPGRLASLIRLMPLYDLTVFPLWPARGLADFLARWLDHHLRALPELREHPEPSLALLTALHRIDIAGRAPQHLDALVTVTAVGSWPADPLAPEAVAAAVERGRALSRLAA
jgi:hypothetical protein